MSALYFDDFAAGLTSETAERTITATDLELFSQLSGDRNALHLDDEYARAAGFDGRIAQGVLGLSVATGLLNQLGLTRGTLVALLGTSWRFERPLYPGTAVRLGVAFERKRQTSHPDRGVVVLRCELHDGAGAVYQRGDLTLLVRRRPTP
jgi:acyl dehydratase